MYRVLKCSKCGKVIPNPYFKNPKRQDSFILHQLRKYLKSMGVNDIRIGKIVDNILPIDGRYNKCCPGYEIIQDQEEDKSLASSYVMDVVNEDAYKEVRGIEYMNNLYGKYASHWNNEDEGND